MLCIFQGAAAAAAVLIMHAVFNKCSALDHQRLLKDY